MIRLACFDFDGTLVSSLSEIAEGIRVLAHQEGLKAPSDEVVSVMIGRGVRVLVEDLRAWWARSETPVPAHLEDEALLQTLVHIWTERSGALITAIPGAFEGVRALRAQGVATWIVTNKEEILARDFLEKHGLEDAFDGILGGNGAIEIRLKPWPDMIHYAIKASGVSARETVMVGDSCNDALAARAAGVRAMLVNTGYNGGVPINQWAAQEGFTEVFPNVGAVCERIIEEQKTEEQNV